MDLQNNLKKYFKKKTYQIGEIFSIFINDLIDTKKYNNIIFIRTPTTGIFFDDILPNNNNIIRICYQTSNIKLTNNSHKSLIITQLDDLEKEIKRFNKKFDLIVIDPYHEYKISYDNFNLLINFLNDNGCIISHDCCPNNIKSSFPLFNNGEWSGQTYLALVKFANNNPELYYSVLNTDTGIGIISKKKEYGLRNDLDKYKQEQLLMIDNLNNYDKSYTYFKDNSTYIINLIEFL